VDQTREDGGESGRLELEGVFAKVAFLNEVALQKALWKQEQINRGGLGALREVFDAAERGLDVTENLWRLTSPNA
jgi:hypothetical protein